MPAFRLIGERAAAERGPASGPTRSAAHRSRRGGRGTARTARRAGGWQWRRDLRDRRARRRKVSAYRRGAPDCRWARDPLAGGALPHLWSRPPYWPFLDLLRRTAGIRVNDPVEGAAERLREALAASAPEAVPFFARLLGLPAAADDGLPELEPEVFRRGLHNAFATWLRTLSVSSHLCSRSRTPIGPTLPPSPFASS